MKSDNDSICTGNIDISNIKMHLDIDIVMTITARLKATNAQRLQWLKVYATQQKTTGHTRTHASTWTHAQPTTLQNLQRGLQPRQSLTHSGLSHDPQTNALRSSNKRNGHLQKANSSGTGVGPQTAKSTRRSVESLRAEQIEWGERTHPRFVLQAESPPVRQRFTQGARTYITHAPALRINQILQHDTPHAR